MFTIKQPVGVPPVAKILIVGGPPYDELSLITRNLCTVMNAHLCCTHYVGDLASNVEYDGMGQYQGEYVSLVHTHSYKYKSTDDVTYSLVFYIGQPNLGIYNQIEEQDKDARLNEHVYYLTLQALRDEVHMVHNVNRSIPDLVAHMLDIITANWGNMMEKINGELRDRRPQVSGVITVTNLADSLLLPLQVDTEAPQPMEMEFTKQNSVVDPIGDKSQLPDIIGWDMVTERDVDDPIMFTPHHNLPAPKDFAHEAPFHRLEHVPIVLGAGKYLEGSLLRALKPDGVQIKIDSYPDRTGAPKPALEAVDIFSPIARKPARKKLKGSERNNPCRCGCGKKVKNCPNRQRS